MVGRKKKQAEAEGAAPEAPSPPPQQEPDGPMPPTYLGMAILSLLLCAVLGIIGLYWGLQVRRRWSRGDEDGAFVASKNAEMFTYGAYGAFLIALVIAIIVAIVRSFTSG